MVDYTFDVILNRTISSRLKEGFQTYVFCIIYGIFTENIADRQATVNAVTGFSS